MCIRDRHTELQTEVTARERQLQARREFLLSEQERKKKLEEEIDIIKTELVRSRRPGVFSLCSCDSWPSDEVGGGFFFEFELFRTASGPSRRWRLHETAPPRRHRRDPTRVYVVIRTPSTRCHITAMLRAGEQREDTCQT